MVWIIAFILALFWLFGRVAINIASPLFHIVLLVAIVMVIFSLFNRSSRA